MKFAGELRLSALKGEVSSENDILNVKNAKEITVRLTAATDYNIDLLDFDRSKDPVLTCKTILDRTENIKSDKLKQRHLEEYQPVFNRVSLSFGNDTLKLVPTDERLLVS